MLFWLRYIERIFDQNALRALADQEKPYIILPANLLGVCEAYCMVKSHNRSLVSYDKVIKNVTGDNRESNHLSLSLPSRYIAKSSERLAFFALVACHKIENKTKKSFSRTQSHPIFFLCRFLCR